MDGLISLALRDKEKPHCGKFTTIGSNPPRNFQGVGTRIFHLTTLVVDG